MYHPPPTPHKIRLYAPSACHKRFVPVPILCDIPPDNRTHLIFETVFNRLFLCPSRRFPPVTLLLFSCNSLFQSKKFHDSIYPQTIRFFLRHIHFLMPTCPFVESMSIFASRLVFRQFYISLHKTTKEAFLWKAQNQKTTTTRRKVKN